jgi:hypothetical protein
MVTCNLVLPLISLVFYETRARLDLLQELGAH